MNETVKNWLIKLYDRNHNERLKGIVDMNETVKSWLIELYEREIKEAIGSISNERIWLMGSDVWEEEKMHLDNMANLNEYITALKILLNDIKEVK
jgi:hypothetical protein